MVERSKNTYIVLLCLKDEVDLERITKESKKYDQEKIIKAR